MPGAVSPLTITATGAGEGSSPASISTLGEAYQELPGSIARRNHAAHGAPSNGRKRSILIFQRRIAAARELEGRSCQMKSVTHVREPASEAVPTVSHLR